MNLTDSSQQSRVSLAVSVWTIVITLWMGSVTTTLAKWYTPAPVSVQVASLPTAPAHTPVKIFSQWFLDSSIQPAEYQAGVWETFPDSVAYWKDSALPDSGGNTVLYGHNIRSQLGNIRAYKGGEKITLTLADGRELVYRVTTTVVTTGQDTQWLEPTNQEVLTLYTCDGFWDTQRFVVRAVREVTVADAERGQFPPIDQAY